MRGNYRRHRPILREGSAEEFIKSPNFIAHCRRYGLNVSASQREVLGLVYSFTIDARDRCYWGSVEHAAYRTGASERTVQRAFAHLTELGLIYREIVSNTRREYVANLELLDKIKADYEAQRKEEWTLYRKQHRRAAQPEITTTKVEIETTPYKEATPLETLLATAVNQNRIRECEKPYTELLMQGFTHAEILSAWTERQEERIRDGAKKCFMPQLRAWLMAEDPSGAKAMIRQARERAAKDKQRKRTAALNRLIQEDAYAESLYQQMQFARTEAEEQQASFRLNQYFEEVYGDAPTSRKGMPRCQQMQETKQRILSSA